MAANNYKFEGWLGLDSDSINGKMVWGDFEPKEFEETDIDIQITHSGMCGSDVHTLRSGWVSLAVTFDAAPYRAVGGSYRELTTM